MFLASAVLVGGYIVYMQYQQKYRTEVEYQLTAVAKLKMHQLVQWRKERLSDANIFYKNDVFSDLIKRYFNNSADTDAKRRIQTWMGQIFTSSSYDRICLHDAAGTEHLSFPKEQIQTSFIFSARSTDVMKSANVEFQDFYRDEKNNQVYLTVLVPVLDEYDSVKTLGILGLRIDPRQYLYPLIEEWPTPSKTAETLILRREGSEVLFLNELRFQKNTALNLRTPLNNIHSAAVKAALGQEGIVEGIDYRGEPVIAYVCAVPHSPWFLVVRMDSSELYAPMRERLWLMIILVGALLIGVGASVSLVWRHQRSRFYEEQYQTTEALRESENRFRTLWNNSLDAMRLTDASGTIVMVNRAFYRLFEKTDEEIVGSSIATTYSPNHNRKILDHYCERFQNHTIAPFLEKKVTLWNGDERCLELSNSFLTFSGKGELLLSVFRDITERKLLEETLAESEGKFSVAFKTSPYAMSITEPQNGRFIEINDTFSTMTGFTREETIDNASVGMDLWVDEKDRHHVVKELGSGLKIVGREFKFKKKNGEIIIGLFSAHLVRIKDNTYILSSINEITKRKQAEAEINRLLEMSERSRSNLLSVLEDQKLAQEALRESEERMEDIIYSVGDWVWEVDANKKYTFSSDKGKDIIGYAPEETIGKTPFDFMPQDEAERVKTIFSDIVSNKAPIKDLENWNIRKDGERICLLTNGVPILDEHGNLKGYRGVDKDISERKRAEEALRCSNEFNQSLLQAIPLGMDIVDEQGTILFLSDHMKKLIGMDALGQTCWSVYKDDKNQCLDCPRRKGIEFGQSEVLEVANFLGGRIFQIKHAGIMYHGKKAILEIFIEVTEQRKLQYQLLQSQKIQSIGTLAGGIAHDFNNILGIILAYSSRLERLAGDKQKIIESGAAITTAVERGAALVRQILTFARQADVTFKPVNIPEFIREMISMLNETFPKVIEISKLIEEEIPVINADHAQMHQALLNLCVNARDAMPGGGTLTIKVNTVDQNIVKKQFTAASAERYVCISVADTGIGMDIKTKERIFDPFFTTKEKGKGTGLGLSVVSGVMQVHHGFVGVESHEDKGTTFYLYLPVQSDLGLERKLEPQESTAHGGTETLLIVEDEEVLRDILHTLLESKGYHLYAAADGIEAVNVYREHRNEIALVLTDVGLPKMTGLDEFKKLKEINPNVKVLLASGFLDLGAKSEIYKAGAKGFIQKPYRSYDVLSKIREVLDME
jgi:PAS domain S-box-containing protein